MAIENFRDVLESTHSLITDCFYAINILLPLELRKEFADAYNEYSEQYESLLKEIDGIEDSGISHLRQAGLVGAQRTFKFKSFEVSYYAYKAKGTIKRLIKALKKGKTILSSLGGAVPMVGSFIQELIDFLLREMEKTK